MVKSLREIYPSLNDEELKEVEERLVAYARLMVRMAKRMAADGSLNRLLHKKRELSSQDEV